MSEVKQPEDSKEIQGYAIKLPPSQVALVLGVTAEGQLYYQAYGNTGLVEIAGLMAYGNHVVNLGFQQSKNVPQTTR